MKKLAVALIVVAGVLSGCVAYETPRDGRDYRGDREREYRGDRDRDGVPNRVDRDGDGVPNRQDRRPDDPRRY
ncbi:MAG: hypothetical protein ACXWCS_19900 [Burkholderiales bacterium]